MKSVSLSSFHEGPKAMQAKRRGRGTFKGPLENSKNRYMKAKSGKEKNRKKT